MSSTNIKRGERQRLELLEHELYWAGRINRQTISSLTGVSLPQATLDIKSYKNLAERNLVYDLTEKAYLATPDFSPLFINTSPHAFLSNLPTDTTATVNYPYRNIDSQWLRIVFQGIQNKCWVTIDYQSMTSSEIKSRIIAPHSFLFDGLRWHVRAYDFPTSSFRDFVLGRIKHAAATQSLEIIKEHQWEQKNDHDWHSEIELHLIPHPGLTPTQSDAIATDYGMVDGKSVFPVRKAALVYVVARLRLLDEASDPSIQQVILANRAQIESALLRPTE